MLLFTRNYLPVIIVGMVGGMVKCLMNLAMSKIPASIAICCVMSCNLSTIVMERVLFGLSPSRAQMASMTAMVCALVSYTLGGMDGGDIDIVGILAAFGAALCMSFNLFAAQLIFVRVKQLEHGFPGCLRCIILSEFGRGLIGAVCFFTIDIEFFLDHGASIRAIFSGWNPWTLVLFAGSLPTALQTTGQMLMLRVFNALTVQVVCATEILFIYGLETLVVQAMPFNLRDFLILCALATSVCGYIFTAQERREAELKAHIAEIEQELEARRNEQEQWDEFEESWQSLVAAGIKPLNRGQSRHATSKARSAGSNEGSQLIMVKPKETHENTGAV